MDSRGLFDSRLMTIAACCDMPLHGQVLFQEGNRLTS